MNKPITKENLKEGFEYLKKVTNPYNRKEGQKVGYENLKEDMFNRWYYHNIMQLKEKGGDDERRRIQQFIVMKDAFKAVFNLGAAFSLKYYRDVGEPKIEPKIDEKQLEMKLDV